MAEVKVIEVQIKSNLDGATSSVSKFKAGLKDATTQSKELGNTLQGSKQSEFIDKLGDGVGKLNPAFGAAVKGANGLILKMWEMVANPVGAILAGIVVTAKFLYEAFQNSVAGGKELKTIFAAISAVGEQVKDSMFGLGRALINVSTAAYKFITLDFKGAAEDMKKANGEATTSYKQLGNAVDGTTFKIIKNLEKQQQVNDKARKNQAVVQSETNKLLVQSREILTDETASINEKKKALAEVTKAEKASSAEKVRIAAEDLRLAKEAATAKGGQIEAKSKQQLRELTIALNEAETENAMTGIKLNKQKKMLGRQEVADAKEKNDAIAAINKEATDKRNAQIKIEQDEIKRKAKEDLDLMMASAKEVMDKEKNLREAQETPLQKEEREYQEWLTKYQANNLNTELLTKQHKDNVDKIILDSYAKDADASIKRTADAKANADAQKAIDDKLAEAKVQNMQRGSAMLGQISDLVGKNTAAGKVAAVAAATIDTYAAAQSAFKNAQLNPISIIGPAYPYISAGLAIAGGLKNVKSILSVKTPGGGGGGASLPSAASIGSGPTAPAFNVVGASATNQLAQTIGQKEQQPVKAYVVSNDVTTAQSLNRNIISSATLG